MSSLTSAVDVRRGRKKSVYMRKQFADAEAILQELKRAYDRSLCEGELLRAKLAILPFGFAAADDSLGVS